MLLINGIFRIEDDTELTPSILHDYIRQHQTFAESNFKKLGDAYKTDYDIFHQSAKAAWKPDNRIAVNFAKYIVDTMQGFFIGIPIKVTADDSGITDYVNLLDQYNDQDDNNAELAKTTMIYGRGYEMYYVDEDGEIGITYLNPCESFMIYDMSILERPRYFVRIYTDTMSQMHGSVSDDTRVRYFDINGSLKFRPDDERIHGFDGVPAVEYIANAERQGMFESVLNMINAYNKAISEKANDVDYFADAYLKILGAKLENEDVQHIRENRIINFDGIGDGNLDVDFMEKPSADTTQEHLVDRLERLIFQISMVANINDENFGAATGIALKYKLQSMSNLAKTLERKFTSGMNRRYKLIFSNPVSGMKRDSWTQLSYTFTRNFPANLLEEAQIAAQLSGITSKETQLSVLSIVDDVQGEMEKIEEEKKDTQYETSRTVNSEDDKDDELLGEETETAE